VKFAADKTSPGLWGFNNARHRGSSNPFTHDGEHRKQRHYTRTCSPPRSPLTRSQIPPARPKTVRHPRSGVSSIRSCLLRSRLFLAPSCRLPMGGHASHPRTILAGEVRLQRGTRPAQPTRTAHSRLASRDCLGMRVAQSGGNWNRAAAGPVAARKQAKVRDEPACECSILLLNKIQGTPASRQAFQRINFKLT